jgi:hypothetical protein
MTTTTNPKPVDGIDRCSCGAKYWDGNTCHSCGQKFDPAARSIDLAIEAVMQSVAANAARNAAPTLRDSLEVDRIIRLAAVTAELVRYKEVAFRLAKRHYAFPEAAVQETYDEVVRDA